MILGRGHKVALVKAKDDFDVLCQKMTIQGYAPKCVTCVKHIFEKKLSLCLSFYWLLATSTDFNYWQKTFLSLIGSSPRGSGSWAQHISESQSPLAFFSVKVSTKRKRRKLKWGSEETFNFSSNLFIVRSFTKVNCHTMSELQKRFNGSDLINVTFNTWDQWMNVDESVLMWMNVDECVWKCINVDE